MESYKCIECGKSVDKSYLRKKVRCPYCGCKMLFKPRTVTTKVLAV